MIGAAKSRAFGASKRGEWRLQTTLLEAPNTPNGTTEEEPPTAKKHEKFK